MNNSVECPRCHAIFLLDYEPKQLDELEEIEFKVDPYETPTMDTSNGTDCSASTSIHVTFPDLGACSPTRCA